MKVFYFTLPQLRNASGTVRKIMKKAAMNTVITVVNTGIVEVPAVAATTGPVLVEIKIQT